MKKFIIIFFAIIAVSIVGVLFLFVIRPISRLPVEEPKVREAAITVPEPVVPPAPSAAFNVDDNLDQALQDLDQLEKL